MGGRNGLVDVAIASSDQASNVAIDMLVLGCIGHALFGLVKMEMIPATRAVSLLDWIFIVVFVDNKLLDPCRTLIILIVCRVLEFGSTGHNLIRAKIQDSLGHRLFLY